uniref:Ribonuclease H-like domain-containing protein n=1 Tax=Tanacetum cinerariifolium TaxID=118510 RepID=A0A6L2NCP4_TANCI|nr:ribonuclease H-like domain-containing protein [Tanacetum cinerariifolium]
MWLFRHKYHADGLLSRYKACLIANGRNQQYGVDCSDTFSPVVKPATTRTVLSLALARNWPMHQLDVKNAFLNGDLTETVYMYQPSGFVDSRFPHHVCRLHRSLYGLNQAHRAWFQRFAGYALRMGFTSSRCDSSLFIYQHGIELNAYTDADWAGFPVTRRSTSGYCVFIGDNLLSWSAKCQVTLSRFSAEAEYRGVANVVAETAWICNLLRELHNSLFTTTLVYCDNVRVLHVSSRYQYAEVFTKGLPTALFEEFRTNLSVRSSSAQTAREC